MAWDEEYFTRLRANIDAYQEAHADGTIVVLAQMTDLEFNAYLGGARDQPEDLTGLSTARLMRVLRS